MRCLAMSQHGINIRDHCQYLLLKDFNYPLEVVQFDNTQKESKSTSRATASQNDAGLIYHQKPEVPELTMNDIETYRNYIIQIIPEVAISQPVLEERPLLDFPKRY